MNPAPCAARLRTSCLVNSYNYGQYVVAAVASALAQTKPFDEIIVVDDGSTDGTSERLRAEFAGEQRVTVIEKRNEGQLSCFHRGFEASTGDLIFFLDADDLYEPEYLATLYEIYRARPTCHFAISAYRTFGREERDVRIFEEDRDLGYSAVLALTRSFIRVGGSPTSTLSMRREVLERFLPLPNLEDWRTQADDCLVFGSSLAGASKYYSAVPLVGYRIHGDNLWYGREWGHAHKTERTAALERLFAEFVRKLGLEGLAGRAHDEFDRIPRPSARQLRYYAHIAARAPFPVGARLRMVVAMFGHFLATRTPSRTNPHGGRAV